ncbi:MAG: winged helix-turn-helix domain-containing protein [Promethearchaeota archaeon]
MSRPGMDELMYEIKELRETVLELQETVRQMSARFERAGMNRNSPAKGGGYMLLSDQGGVIEGDASWLKLVTLLREADQGLTATELAPLWGRSRSRTSEVLNILVQDGQLVKYRDGRTIRFRTS